MRDDRSFIGGMRDKNTSAGAGFAHFDRRDAGLFLKLTGDAR